MKFTLCLKLAYFSLRYFFCSEFTKFLQHFSNNSHISEFESSKLFLHVELLETENTV